MFTVPAWVVRDRQIPRAHYPASLAFLGSSKLVKTLAHKTGLVVPEEYHLHTFVPDTFTYAHAHAYTPPHNTRICIHVCIYMYIHSHAHTYTHTCIHACILTYTHAHTFMHTHIHMYVHGSTWCNLSVFKTLLQAELSRPRWLEAQLSRLLVSGVCICTWENWRQSKAGVWSRLSAAGVYKLILHSFEPVFCGIIGRMTSEQTALVKVNIEWVLASPGWT